MLSKIATVPAILKAITGSSNPKYVFGLNHFISIVQGNPKALAVWRYGDPGGRSMIRSSFGPGQVVSGDKVAIKASQARHVLMERLKPHVCFGTLVHREAEANHGHDRHDKEPSDSHAFNVLPVSRRGSRA